MIYLISGLSGSGKSTVGQRLATVLNAVFLDQDYFYVDKKPKVTLSNGSTVSNWDCIEAINWIELNFKVNHYVLKGQNVVLVGFALWAEKLNFTADRWINLSYGPFISKCLEHRRAAKNIDPVKDELVVKEVVLPFLQITQDKIKPDKTIFIYTDAEERKSVQDLLEEILN